MKKYIIFNIIFFDMFLDLFTKFSTISNNHSKSSNIEKIYKLFIIKETIL